MYRFKAVSRKQDSRKVFIITCNQAIFDGEYRAVYEVPTTFKAVTVNDLKAFVKTFLNERFELEFTL